jgi:hypothetical protein
MLLENKVAVLNAHDLCRRETTLCSDPNLSSWPADSPRFSRGITPERARQRASLGRPAVGAPSARYGVDSRLSIGRSRFMPFRPSTL